MLLQINTDTTDSLIVTGNTSSENMWIFVVGAILLILVIIFFSRRSKTKTVKHEKKDKGTEGKISGGKSVVPPIKEIQKKPEKKSTEIKVNPEPALKKAEIKKIGYNPVNVFAQSEPLNFPFVLMPNTGCVIMFPRKGRTGRKGYKEDDFKKYLDKHFRSSHQLFDDRFILVKGLTSPFEPDFTLIDEKAGLNLFIDIEIDEPYEGLNDIEKRKATHYQLSDANRNNAFKSRGWIVIRFAEIQVHQQPEECCKFVADVIKSISPAFLVNEQLQKANQVKTIPQWTKGQALQWSKEKYREKYLGIDKFGITPGELNDEVLTQTKEEEQIEKEVKDEPLVETEKELRPILDSNGKLIGNAITGGSYLAFEYEGARTIIKPSSNNNTHITGFCYVKNNIRTFNIQNIKNLTPKAKYYSLRVSAPNIGVENVKSAVTSAIQYDKYVRMKYTRAAWNTMDVNTETGEIIMTNVVEAEESTRTINNIKMATDVLSEEHLNYYRLDENYINAYCHKREEKRTFKFDRIGEIEILDI